MQPLLPPDPLFSDASVINNIGQSSNTMSRVGRAALVLFNVAQIPVSSLVLQGLANCFGCCVLTHATSFFNYFSILNKGGEPKPDHRKVSIFCVTKCNWLGQKILDRVYAARSGFYRNNMPFIEIIVRSFLALLATPSIRIVVNQREVTPQFNLLHNSEYHAYHPIPSHQIGLFGLVGRMSMGKPCQIIKGIFQVALGIYLTKKGYGFFI